jgi:3-oxoacyl-[acyl-carrier protein] reductase
MARRDVEDPAVQTGTRMQLDLTGKVALVTGGTRGIGHDICRAFVDAGARVALCSRDGAAAEQTASAFGEGTRGYACDVGVSNQVEAFAKAVEKDFGQIDVLVNNAGFTKDNLLFLLSEADWDIVMDTNLKGAFLMTKYAARGMIKRRWGRVINITSVVGLNGNKGQSNYSASKAGMIGFTKSVAKELASRNVLVNAVAPGYIDTELTRGITPEAKKYLMDNIPLGRLGQGTDIASAVLFLASDLASYITGQILVDDGGMVM